MKITLIREDRESGKETLSTCEADAWIDRIKTETKEEHVTRLRSMLLYTNSDSGGYYEHIDKLPRIYPSVEFGRSRDNGRKLKHYNGVVMLEVNHLAGTGETAGGFVTANLGGFCRKQWTERKDLGKIRPAGRKFAGERRKHRVFSRTRLPHGRAMLPAHIAVSHHAARAFYDAKLPHDA